MITKDFLNSLVCLGFCSLILSIFIGQLDFNIGCLLLGGLGAGLLVWSFLHVE